MTKSEELLKVLDLPENEQEKWAAKRFQENPHCCGQFCVECIKCKEEVRGYGFDRSYEECSIPDDLKESLADLAFSLRDEVEIKSSKFMWACAEVYNHAHHFKLKESETHAPTTVMWIWFATQAQPIHWIIAALIAKAEKP